jgi:beta-N-acetylhexosaminidase
MVPMVMVTHILNPQLDASLPTSLSPKVVTGLLRDTLHFQGVIISDTLWMGGISNTYSLAQAAVLAVKAGTDLLLGPRGVADTQTMLYGLHQAVMSGQISESQIDASVMRILALKLKYKMVSHDKALQVAHSGGASEMRGNVESGHDGTKVPPSVERSSLSVLIR